MKKIDVCSFLFGAVLLASLFPQTSSAQVGAGNTTFINSTVSQDVVTTLPPVINRVKGYNTQVLGILSNNGSNTTVFNVTVNSTVNLNEIRQQIALARRAVQSAHNITGNPTLNLQASQLTTSQAPAITTNTTVVSTPNGEATNVTTEAILGPNVTTYGENRSLTFNIAAGTTNFNTVVYTYHLFNSQSTTTETTRKNAVYQVVGLSSGGAQPR